MVKRWLVTAAAALAALLLVPGASADQSYFDPPGDSVNGSPDITSIRVVHDANRKLTFTATVAGFPAQNTDIYLYVDADRNGSTGDEGWDYSFGIDFTDALTYAWRWNGSAWVGFVPTSGSASFQSGVWLVTLSTADLANTTSFDFYYSASKYSGQVTLGLDEAPDGTAFYTYTLTQAPPPQPPPSPPPSAKTFEDASRLPSRIRYVGKSIKHVRLGEKLYRTMKSLGAPKVVAIACWSQGDWPSVLESAGGLGEPGTVTAGFFRFDQPRWLHIAPKQCSDVQALINTRAVNGQRAYALATVLHERVHADGYRNEAQTNCYGVQLVYDFARELNFVPRLALRLEQLAVRKARAVAPPGYWDAVRCSDGGKWDLFEVRNLSY